MASAWMRESFGVLFRLFGEGCAVASMLGLLEAREAAARVRVEELREAAARAAAVLEAAEIELERRVIAREELAEALAVSAAETTAVTEPEAKAEVPVPVPLPGRTVPFWRGGLPATVLAPDYRRILGMVADRSGQGPVRAQDALATVPAQSCSVWRGLLLVKGMNQSLGATRHSTESPSAGGWSLALRA